MRPIPLLATLLLLAAATALAPTAAGSACVSEDPVDDVECVVDVAEETAECLAARPPMHWHHCRVPL